MEFGVILIGISSLNINTTLFRKLPTNISCGRSSIESHKPRNAIDKQCAEPSPCMERINNSPFAHITTSCIFSKFIKRHCAIFCSRNSDGNTATNSRFHTVSNSASTFYPSCKQPKQASSHFDTFNHSTTTFFRSSKQPKQDSSHFDTFINSTFTFSPSSKQPKQASSHFDTFNNSASKFSQSCKQPKQASSHFDTFNNSASTFSQSYYHVSPAKAPLHKRNMKPVAAPPTRPPNSLPPANHSPAPSTQNPNERSINPPPPSLSPLPSHEVYSPATSPSASRHHHPMNELVSPVPAPAYVVPSPTSQWQGPTNPPFTTPTSMQRNNAPPPFNPGSLILPPRSATPGPINNVSPAPSSSPNTAPAHPK
ncbi:hypothetical protein CRG98_030523, partial [Punica granatum]